MASILVVDDDAGIRESAALALEKVGHRTSQAGDVVTALQLMRDRKIDVVVSDIYMPGDDGLTLARAISERRDPPRVILMTARGSVETTALAQKFGAVDYLAKPFDLRELIDAVANALAPPSNAAAPAIEPAPPSRIIGSHRTMVEMYKAISRVASIDVPVIIRGENALPRRNRRHLASVSGQAPALPAGRRRDAARLREEHQGVRARDRGHAS